jgi:hypothetical protein
LGDWNNEDSVYSVLIPTNRAWIAAYQRIKNYYKTTTAEGGSVRQDALTKKTLIQDLSFRQSENPVLTGSVVSTIGHRFAIAEDLFYGAIQNEVSNGLFFLTDSLRHKATESWHREILVEAENTDWGRTNMNANVFFRTSAGSGFSASGGKYITVEPTVLNDISEVSVTFPIPNTLSASNLIYCVFMPEIIADTSSHKPNIVTFSIDYVDSNGKQLTNQSPNSWKNIVTKANDTTMVNLGKFTFPYSISSRTIIQALKSK